MVRLRDGNTMDTRDMKYEAFTRQFHEDYTINDKRGTEL